MSLHTILQLLDTRCLFLEPKKAKSKSQIHHFGTDIFCSLQKTFKTLPVTKTKLNNFFFKRYWTHIVFIEKKMTPHLQMIHQIFVPDP